MRLAQALGVVPLVVRAESEVVSAVHELVRLADQRKAHVQLGMNKPTATTTEQVAQEPRLAIIDCRDVRERVLTGQQASA